MGFPENCLHAVATMRDEKLSSFLRAAGCGLVVGWVPAQGPGHVWDGASPALPHNHQQSRPWGEHLQVYWGQDANPLRKTNAAIQVTGQQQARSLHWGGTPANLGHGQDHKLHTHHGCLPRVPSQTCLAQAGGHEQRELG